MGRRARCRAHRYGHREHPRDRIGIKALIYSEVLTTVALAIGLVAMNLSHAGVGLRALNANATASSTVTAAQPLGWQQFLLRVFPDDLAKAVADDQIFEVAIFALLFGLALGELSKERRAPILRLVESLTETRIAFTKIVMYYAPVGVGATIVFATSTSKAALPRWVAP